MNITIFSRNRLWKTIKDWEVPGDFADSMANYLVYGYEPGSCFTAVLANDFYRAIRSSHPSNTVEAFKSLAGWINECFPKEAYGSYDKISAWCSSSPEYRRNILEQNDLIYTSKEEVWMALKGEVEFV